MMQLLRRGLFKQYRTNRKTPNEDDGAEETFSIGTAVRHTVALEGSPRGFETGKLCRSRCFLLS